MPKHEHVKRTLSYEFGTIAPEHEADILECLCEGFVRANQMQIALAPDDYPCCLSCGEYKYVPPESCVTYDWRKGCTKTRDRNCQHVLGAWPLNTKKRGTCIDLACMLCAIYRVKEGDTKARVIIDHQFGPNGERVDGVYHAMVMRGDGTIVDPNEKVKPASPLAVGGCACETKGT